MSASTTSKEEAPAGGRRRRAVGTVERLLEMSRSKFLARAASRYLDELDVESVTRQIDVALDALQGSGESSAAAVAAAHRVLADTVDEW